MAGSWELSEAERRTLEEALDALLPPEGSFPAPSSTGIIDDFILRRVPESGQEPLPYPGLSAAGLRAVLARLAGHGDMTDGLRLLESEQPVEFLALWQLAVYGYYSRPETIKAIQTDLACEYHGAPLPVGYAHVLTPWEKSNPLEMPRRPAGSYIRTEDVRRVDVRGLEERQ